VDIGSRAGCTGLAVGMVALSLFQGCSTTAPDQGVSRTDLRAVATECAKGKTGLKVDRVDDDGEVHLAVLPDGHLDVAAFSACYTRKTAEALPAGGPHTGPARVAEPPIIERSAVRPASREASVKLHTVNNKFLVPVVLNDVQTATFLLDTGASGTIVSPSLAQTLKLRPLPGEPKAKVRMASGQEVEVTIVRVKAIAVGPARMNNFDVVVYNSPAVSSSAGPGITVDGLLGTDFLGRFRITLDPRAETLTFYLDDDSPAK